LSAEGGREERERSLRDNYHHKICGKELAMSNIITLYHGTIHEFDKIDVTKGKGNKDFGRGFYASRDVRHAERLAVRNKSIEEERFALRGVKKSVTPWLYAYDFDLENLVALNAKEFASADREWMRFVVLNRESKKQSSRTRI
jgi:hypothetical protein